MSPDHIAARRLLSRRGLQIAAMAGLAVAAFVVITGIATRSSDATHMSEWAESQAFTMWSWPKRVLFYWHGARYLAYIVSLVVFSALVAARAGQPYFAATALLISMALIEMGVAGLGDAAEITRHFFLFNALSDILLLSTIAALLAPRSAASGPVLEKTRTESGAAH